MQLNHERRGSGEPLVLIHGIGSHWQVWEPVLDRLAAQREVMPLSVGVFVPPNWDRRYVECFGQTIEDVYEQGMTSLESKLRAAGLPLDELPGAPPLPVDMKPEERVERAIAMLKGKLRPRGSIRLLMRMPRLFGR